jgi:biopolymer transport protein ExbD
MRRSFETKKLARKMRKPAELLLVPMIDIFTVLVTFLLMTAVFSRTVILQLNLPASQTEFRDPPPGLQLEVMVRKNMIVVADRNTGPLAPLPNTAEGYNYEGLTDYLKRVKAKFPEKTDASILLEADTPYDILVQVMDRVRVFETKEGLNTVQAELFPDISIGDAPAGDDAGGTAPAANLTPVSPAGAPVPNRQGAAPAAPASNRQAAAAQGAAHP